MMVIEVVRDSALKLFPFRVFIFFLGGFLVEQTDIFFLMCLKV